MPDRPEMIRAIIISDDLTGALDSAAAFAARGCVTRVALSPEALDDGVDPDVDVLAVSTNSREAAAEAACDAVAAVRAGLDRLGARATSAVMFKKIDSRLKGHVAVEAGALRHAGQPVLVCPAIPRLGRLVSAGAVSGAGVAEPLPVAPACAGLSADIPDAGDDAALDRIVAQAASGTLFVGAAGLAEALARRIAPGHEPVPPRLPAPALLAVGSRDPVSLAQLEALSCVTAPNGAVPADLGPDDMPCRIVQMTQGDTTIPGAEAGAAFADGIAGHVRAARPATLIACGGESAAAVLRGLGVRWLALQGEALPGVPVARTRGLDPELTVVTKSGGFGARDTFTRLIEMLAMPEAATKRGAMP